MPSRISLTQRRVAQRPIKTRLISWGTGTVLCPLWPSAMTVTGPFDGATALGRQKAHGPHSAPRVSCKRNEIVTRKFMSLGSCSKHETCLCLEIHHSQCDEYFYSQLFEPTAQPARERHIRSQKQWM